VRELISRSSSAYLEVDDVAAARRLLEQTPGVRRVADEPPGLSLDLDGAARSELVRLLVGAGIAVETVMSRHQLEDAFLGLVGEHTERHVGKGA
jgi:ABC-2 type transport system ATP-binding protein